MKKMTPKAMKVRRYAYFWCAIIFCFVPHVVVTACLLPFMVESAGLKWGIGIALVFINTIPFVFGFFKSFFIHFPFFNWIALIFICCAGFFTLDVFADYVYTFKVIESVSVAGGILACVFWGLHRKYKAKDGQVKTMRQLGVL